VTDEFLVNACVTFQETMLLSNSVSPPKEISLKTGATNSGNFPTGNGTALSKFHRLRSILLPCFGLVGCLGAFGQQRVLRARCGGCLNDAWFIMVHHHLPSENG
jgi:hypothetical protein